MHVKSKTLEEKLFFSLKGENYFRGRSAPRHEEECYKKTPEDDETSEITVKYFFKLIATF